MTAEAVTQDDGSLPRVLVNGCRLRRSVKLDHGDRILVGFNGGFRVCFPGGAEIDSQDSLEAALVEFPAGDFKENPKDRWRAIAGGVDGKTAKLCLLRYKALAAAVKAKQGA